MSFPFNCPTATPRSSGLRPSRDLISEFRCSGTATIISPLKVNDTGTLNQVFIFFAASAGTTCFLSAFCAGDTGAGADEVFISAEQYCPSPSTKPGTSDTPCSVRISPSYSDTIFTTSAPSSSAAHATFPSFSYLLNVQVEYIRYPFSDRAGHTSAKILR